MKQIMFTVLMIGGSTMYRIRTQALAMHWSGSEPVASAGPTCPMCAWEASADGPFHSATRWPASRWVGATWRDRRRRPGHRVSLGRRSGPDGNGATQGGLTPLLQVPDTAGGRRLYRVPDGMPATTAALAEPPAVGMQAVNQSGAEPGDKVAVFGCGPIGLMSLATLSDRGIDDVVAIDLSQPRLELAKQVGADHLLDATRVDVWAELKRIHGTAPFMFGPTAATDVFIEASGADTVLGDVLRHGRVGGRLSSWRSTTSRYPPTTWTCS